MKYKGTRIIIESLMKEGVDTLFCYIGGKVIPIFDELYKVDHNIKLIQPRHEQGGTHAADGYARSTGKVGVVLVTSGPGATNTVTGIATAYMDSIPMVVLTGQVSTTEIGTDAFQEADITGITLPITKTNFLIKDIDDLAVTIKKAFHIAKTGRPGPVLIDIPVDIQNNEAKFQYPKTLDLESYNPKEVGHPKQIKAALNLLEKSKKPLVLVGGGVNFSDATPLVNEFLNKFNLPMVTTLMGHGADPDKEELFHGGIGMHGTLYGNYAIQNADVLLALGTRFSDRILGETKSFASHAKIIHVDIDPAEIDKNKKINVPIVGTIQSVIQELINKGKPSNAHEEWIRELADYKERNPLAYSSDSLKPQQLIQLANQYFPDDVIVSTDVGQNQMWVAQYFRFRQPRSLLTSGGLGTMGFSLPAAIGAQIGNPHKQVLMVSGDGGFQMNIQELTTIKKYNLNVKMLVLDNSYLGMVRQWQELLCDERYSETDMSDNPDFSKITEAYGIKAKKISKIEEAQDAMIELVESKTSMLLHAIVDQEENVLPMVPPGKSLDYVISKIKGD